MSKKTIVAAAASLFIFALTAAFTVSGWLNGINNSLMEFVYSLETPFLTRVLIFVSNMGEWYVYVPITLLLIALPTLRLRFGFPVAATLTASAALNVLLKNCFAVPRPDTHRLIEVTGFSFPSGHSMNGAAFIGICTLLFVRYSHKKAHKIIASASAVLFVLALGFSRVYLGAHAPADVIAGYSMGLFVCLVEIVFIHYKAVS